MKFIIGLIVVFASTLVGFTLSGGALLALWHPTELLIIGGAAFGAFIITNPASTIKMVFSGIGGLFGGSPYTRDRYLQTFGLLYSLFQKARKEGLMGIENDIEEPQESDIFSKFPDVIKDHHAITFLCDYMRMVVGGNMNPFELDSMMDDELEAQHEHHLEGAEAINRMADALPGFGIVAAVLGIVITMASLTEGPEVIGHKVAAALVGTFTGILLSYGFLGPVSGDYHARANDEAHYLGSIKAAILASVQGYTPQIAIEFARKAMPGHIRPSFQETEEYVRSL